MQIGPTIVLDTHAEAFTAHYARVIVTAADGYWAETAARSATGYGTSLIGCDSEAGVERLLSSGESPDGRPGVVLLFFAFSQDKLAAAVANRIGQCVLTCPTTACFNGLPEAAESIALGDWVRYFGDGHEEQSARSEERPKDRSRSSPLAPPHSAVWRIPVMDGEFLVDAVAGVGSGIAGGNFVIHAESQQAGLAAALRAAGAISLSPGAIAPFPGGVCRAGSKVGSKYSSLVASTDETYCPTLRDTVASQMIDGASCAYELIIDGVDMTAVSGAMAAAIEAAAGRGILAIGARNFAGRLGKHQLRLYDILDVQ